MTRIPRQIMVQDQLDVVPNYKFAISSNPQEIARQKQQRGQKVNIIDHQAGGERVAGNVLAILHDDPELQKIWAHFVGGATLNSAMFMFRQVGPDDLADRPMNRRFWIPDQDQEGNRLGTDSHENTTLALLDELQADTNEYASPDFEKQRTVKKKEHLARRTAEVSILLGVFGEPFPENEDELETMKHAKRLIRSMQQDALGVALRIGMSPTAAMLRSESSRLGVYIREASTDGTMPPEIAEAFREGVAEQGDQLGY